MKLLISLPFYSKHVYESVFSDISQRTNQQFRKYMTMFTSGLVKNDVDVYVACSFAVNKKNCSKKVVSYADEESDGIKFHYFTTLNIRLLNRIIKLFQSLFFMVKFCRREKKALILCDPNAVASCIGTVIGTKLAGGRVVHLLTDLPSIHTGRLNKRRNIRQVIADWIISRADGYIFITEAMRDILRIGNKPFIVSEGMVDSQMAWTIDSLDSKYTKRVVMYTGGIRKHYGLEELIRAFHEADVPNTELHIYGGGSYVEEMSLLCNSMTNVHYKGVVDNSEIVMKQKKATLLVNPRISGNEYTKYSFPIKNLEYLASGTPTLSTRLPGMPKEYYDHLYLFDGETSQEMSNKLRELLSKSNEELFKFGQEAKKWVLKEKNNLVQMRKIKNFLIEL